MDYRISDKVQYLNNMLCEIDNLYQSMLLSKGLSDSEYVVLFSILEIGEGCLQKDIANNSYINKKTINSTIKKLEKQGIIRLQAGKYPNMHIYLTEAGQEYMKNKIFPIIHVEDNVMNSVDNSEFQNIVCAYSKYIQIFKEEVSSFKKNK